MPIIDPERREREPGCFGARWTGEPVAAQTLTLRRPRLEDVGGLVALANDPDVARTTERLPYPYGRDDAERFVAVHAEAGPAADDVALVIERLADRQVVGCCGFRRRDGVPEAGYWIGRPFWGRGIATEAVRRLLRLLFLDLDAERVGADVMADNPASARVLAKAGLAPAGTGTGTAGRCTGRPLVRYEMERAAWLARWRTRPRLLVVAVALVDADGRVLVARRPEGKPMAGLWEFPGGKVDDGETPPAALVRELAEELAIDVTESCLAPLAFASHDYEDVHLVMPLWVCRTWKGTVRPVESQELRWMRPARLAELPMPPADVPLVAMLRDALG